LLVCTAAASLTGDIAKAIYWYRNEPIADYDHKAAGELVSEAHVDAVIAHLHEREIGASG
jgi:hypothetical protein